jgi:hypothetical protein
MAYTNLRTASASFNEMMEHGFGIVTVMNAEIYEALDVSVYKTKTPVEVVTNPGTCLCRLDTLKIANVTQEGPTKTITGGQFSNPLIKFGKSARLEMQDALGNAQAIEALCGGIQEWSDARNGANLIGLHFGEDFVGPKLIIGDSFFIDRKSGKQVPVKIVFYQFLPDSIFNLTQDAEGDATVFDMNGDLLTTEVKIGRENGDDEKHGIFYSILNPSDIPTFEVTTTSGVVSVTPIDYSYKYSEDGGLTWIALPKTQLAGKTIDIAAVKGGDSIVIKNNYEVPASNE